MTGIYPTIVVGAGPAGLATSQELLRHGIDHLVVERGNRIGYSWAHLYDSLVLHTGKHLSALPGMPFPSATPLFPRRLDFIHYLDRYARTFGLPVETGVDIALLQRDGDGWRLVTGTGREIHARLVVVATGIVSNPQVPEIPGRERFGGRIMHSVHYREPEPFRSRRVLVVGAGNSAAEIAVELTRTATSVSLSVRSGAEAVPRQLLGIPIQYIAVALSVLPRGVQRTIRKAVAQGAARLRGPAVLPPPRDGRCSEIPLIGLHLIDALRAGTIRLKPGIDRFTDHGSGFVDGTQDTFDDIILATGYRPALGLLGNLVRTDECGFPLRHRRVVSADYPGLYFVGHTYDTQGALRNINMDARLAARIISSVNSQAPTPNSQREPLEGTE